MRPEERWRRLERQWKRWAGRPPGRDPARAAREVMARLDSRPQRALLRASGFPTAGRWRWAAVAALLVLAAALWRLTPWLGPGPAAPGVPALAGSASTGPASAASQTPVIEDGVVVLWLDAETPLYMTFSPPDDSRMTAATAPGKKGQGS